MDTLCISGGRVSNAAALVGSVPGIKPVLYVPDGGTLDVAKKGRGRIPAFDTKKGVVSKKIHRFLLSPIDFLRF